MREEGPKEVRDLFWDWLAEKKKERTNVFIPLS
jgi:hypothetical protein